MSSVAPRIVERDSGKARVWCDFIFALLASNSALTKTLDDIGQTLVRESTRIYPKVDYTPRGRQ